jgi:hypothetical protein
VEFSVEPKAADDTRRWRIEIERTGGYEVVETWENSVEADTPDRVHEVGNRAV